MLYGFIFIMFIWFCYRFVYNKVGGFSEGGKVGLDLLFRFLFFFRFVFRFEI